MQVNRVSRRRSVRMVAAGVLASAVAIGAAVLAGPAEAATVDGLDVAHYQNDAGAINWAQVRAGGRRFVYIKATEGNGYRDPFGARNYSGARDAGLFRGYYHFARPDLTANDAINEARFFFSATGPVNRAGDLPPALDLETNGSLSPAQLQTWTGSFLAELERLSGRVPVIYTGPAFWESRMGNSTAFHRYPLWLSHYTTGAPRVPGGWPSYTIWQHTSTGRIPGIVGNVDLNRFNGNETDLARFANSSAAVNTVTAGQAYTIGETQHVFGRIDERVTHYSWDPAHGVRNELYGSARIQGAPVGFTYGNESHLFARGSGGSLVHNWQVAGGTVEQDEWAPIGSVASEPTGFAVPNEQHVFYRTPDGKLAHQWWNVADARRSSDTWNGPAIAGNPVAFTYGNEQHVFARGADDSLIHFFYVPGMAQPASDRWADPGTVASDPTGFSASNEQHVFFRTADGKLGHRWWNLTAGTLGADIWAGQVPLAGNPASYLWGDQQHVFSRGTDGSLVHLYYVPGASSPGSDVWAPAGDVSGDPIGLASATQQHVFYRKAQDGTLYHRFWDTIANRPGEDSWGGAFAANG